MGFKETPKTPEAYSALAFAASSTVTYVMLVNFVAVLGFMYVLE